MGPKFGYVLDAMSYISPRVMSRDISFTGDPIFEVVIGMLHNASEGYLLSLNHIL